MGEPAKLASGGIVPQPELIRLGSGSDKEHIINLNRVSMEVEEAKMLGALVPADIYWKFKEMVTKRKENMQEAMVHAALLYIECDT
jgi:Sec7-like guanine-nucleotide exchange factor